MFFCGSYVIIIGTRYIRNTEGMMDFIRAMLIGIVHGVTAFLPVSSSGHAGLIGDLWGMQGAEASR